MRIRRCSGLSTRNRPPKDQNACPPSEASGSWSTRMTRRPASASLAVATRPARPPPTTMTSATASGAPMIRGTLPEISRPGRGGRWTSMTTFTALPTGEPDAGAGVVDRAVADAGGGFPGPRRRRAAAPGDELLLLGYDPFAVASPYAGRGPVYVHAGPCPAHVDDGELPPAGAGRSPLSGRGHAAARPSGWPR